MTEQRFPAGGEPRVRISRVRGDLTVEVWDEDAILVESDGRVRELFQENDDLVLDGCDDDLELRVPARTALVIAKCDDDVHIEGVRRVEIERVSGDLELEAIAEEVIVGSVGGDLEVEGLAARLQVGSVGGDLEVEGPGAVTAGEIGGDLSAEGVASLHVSQVGGDLELEGDLLSAVSVGNVGGDLSCSPVRDLRIGTVGGDLEVAQVVDRIEVGNVGSDVEIAALEGDMELGNVGGDLSLRASMRPGSRARAIVGGDAEVAIGAEPNLTITAVVGGELSGVGGSDGGGHKRINLRYGAGEAALELTVAGDLEVGGGSRPESRSSSFGAEFAGDWEEFGREMSDLGRELGRLGREIGNEVAAAFAAEGVAGGAGWAEEIARRIDEKARRVREQAEEKARHAGEQARVRVKINEREWQLDPERLERIKEQARRAAADGLSGALEAVERALSRMRVPPKPGAPPTPGAPPEPPAPPAPPSAPSTGQTIRIERIVEEEVATAPERAEQRAAEQPTLEQERETILRMIAEGRVSPEEGDLLLEALG
ncbi:MAG: hypothetical protein HGA45_08115 [Chloroflexales bacterium]|nr:hypothetical protein [Chloroflexales bacterium]